MHDVQLFLLLNIEAGIRFFYLFPFDCTTENRYDPQRKGGQLYLSHLKENKILLTSLEHIS